MIKRVDENGNVRLITNIRKPRKWRRYEYLESSGTLWIDTGVALSLTDKFEFETDFTYSPANNRACPFYGTENYLTGFMAQYHYTSNTLYVVYIKGALFGGSNISITASSRMYSKTVINIPNKAWATMYNTTSANGTYSNLITDTTSTVKFFGNDLYNKYVAKCYYFKIKINDILIRHFVPAQYNGQYGMWDLVEDRFYPNKGTGTFTVGPEMKNYDEIDEVRKTTSLLPSGVELYDYIQSSGTLWIDTNYYITSDINEMEVKLYSSPTNGSIFGSQEGSNYSIIPYTSSSSTSIYIGNSHYSPVTFTSNQWNIYNVKTLSNKAYLVSLNNNTYSGNYTGNILKTLSITLFKCNYPSAYIIKNRISYFYIKSNNQLVRNFLPCTYLGEPGMWDTVENKFYRNQGTGLFTLGNKITLKEYEYLEANKAPYIDTQFIPKGNTSVEMQLMALSSTQNNGFFGAYGSGWADNSYGFYGWSGEKIWNNYKNDVAVGTYTSIFPINTIHKVFKDKNTLYIDNRLIRQDAYTNFTAPYTLLIFDINKSNNRCPAKMRLYYTKIWDNNTLVRDFIPVSYNGTPGLWDKVEWKFYANAGSGSFTLGPEKKSGSIYLHSHLTNLFNGFVAGGLMALSNGVLIGTGANSDTYFYTKTTQAVNTTSYYLVGVYVEGYTSATAWTFRSPQSDSNATLKITRDGWNWGYVKFSSSNSQPIWDDVGKPSPAPKITISDCRIYKIT